MEYIGGRRSPGDRARPGPPPGGSPEERIPSVLGRSRCAAGRRHAAERQPVAGGATMTRLTVASTLFLLVLGAGIARGQNSPPPPPVNSGPMTLERIENGFAIMPEVKATRIDHTTGALAGATGG